MFPTQSFFLQAKSTQHLQLFLVSSFFQIFCHLNCPPLPSPGVPSNRLLMNSSQDLQKQNILKLHIKNFTILAQLPRNIHLWTYYRVNIQSVVLLAFIVIFLDNSIISQNVLHWGTMNACSLPIALFQFCTFEDTLNIHTFVIDRSQHAICWALFLPFGKRTKTCQAHRTRTENRMTSAAITFHLTFRKN